MVQCVHIIRPNIDPMGYGVCGYLVKLKPPELRYFGGFFVVLSFGYQHILSVDIWMCKDNKKITKSKVQPRFWVIYAPGTHPFDLVNFQSSLQIL